MASGYYNPQKAHEYYLRTRELKGREKGKEKASLKTDEQKSYWEYTKQQIESDKKKNLNKVSASRKAEMQKLRGVANLRRTAIKNKLRDLVEKVNKASLDKRKIIATNRKSELEKLAKNQKTLMDALPKMPKGLNEAQRKKFAEDRAKKVARIRGTIQSEKIKVVNNHQILRNKTSEGSNKIKGAARATANKERASAASDLKVSVAKSRDNYAKLKTALVLKYKKTFEAERDAIANKQNI